jgi:nucleosome-remodeling factor subunit BPTF
MSAFFCSCEQVSGVVDCIPDGEKSGLLCRQEHLGFDRHGRKYWFLARRIFVYVYIACISVIFFLS